MPRLTALILLLGATLAAPVPAVAQELYQLSPADIGRAQSYCNSLAARANSSLTDSDDLEQTEPSSDPAAGWSRGASGLDVALSSINLNALTVAKCRALGLL